MLVVSTLWRRTHGNNFDADVFPEEASLLQLRYLCFLPTKQEELTCLCAYGAEQVTKTLKYGPLNVIGFQSLVAVSSLTSNIIVMLS